MRYQDANTRVDTVRVQTDVQNHKQAIVAAPSVSALQGFKVVVNNTTAGGATASFNFGGPITGIHAVRLLRGQENSFANADVLQEWSVIAADIGKTFSYNDLSPLLALETVYYWLQIVPTQQVADSPYQSNQVPLYTIGPLTFDQLNTNQLPPPQIQSISVSLGPATAGVIPVYVNWLAPQDTTNFSYMRVLVTGYNGTPPKTFLTQTSFSPFSFTMIETGETVTLFAEAVSLTGLVNTTSPPSVSITLNGTPTVPASILDVIAFEIQGGNQVNFAGGLEPSITLYTIYKSAVGAGSGASSSIGTVASSPGTTAYSFLDSTAVNQAFDYYVKVTDTYGTSGFSNTATTSGAPDTRGNLKFSVTDGFAYTADGTNIHWYWDGTNGSVQIKIYRSDGVITTIPNGSQNISGLSNSTSYHSFPFWNEVSQALEWVTIGSSTGTPTYAYTTVNSTLVQVQNQELISHISLAFGGMVGATTAGAGGGGTGGGGGGGGGSGCFTGNMRIETPRGLVRFDNQPEQFLIRNENGIRMAKLIVHENFDGELLDMGNGLMVTPGHIIRLYKGDWTTAGAMFPQRRRIAFKGTVYNLHVESENPFDQHYILENGLIAHNLKLA